MSRTKSVVLISGATVGLAAMTASAQNLDPERAYGAELMADAEARSSLLQAGGAGYSEDRGFFIGDSNYSLNATGYFAFRYVANIGSEAGTAPNDRDGANGFQNVQSQLAFDGNIINPDTSYRISFDLSDQNEGIATLEDAFIAYEMENGIKLTAGQFWVPFAHQEYRVAENKQLGASRSIATENFGFAGIKRTQGVHASQQGEDLEWIVALTDGANAANTGFAGGGEADFSITARANWKFSGDWSDFSHASSFRGAEDAAFIGAAFHFQTGGETIGTADQDLTGFAFDGQYKSDGWQATGQFMFLNVDPINPGGTPETESDFISIVANGSYFVTDNWEVFGEYSFLDLDNNALSEDALNFLTFGATYWFIPESYAARATVDVVIALDQTGFTAPATANAITADATRATGVVNSTEDSQVALRGQIEFSY